MRFLRENALRLAVGISLIFAGYTLGAFRMDPDPVGVLFVSVIVVATWLLLMAETQGSAERSTQVTFEKSVAKEVAREFDRARRSGRPLALARYRLGAQLRASRLNDKQLDRIQKTVRAVDRVWLDRDGLHLLMPDSDRNSATTALVRLRERLPALADLDPVVVVFPKDGITVGSLVRSLSLVPRPEGVAQTDRSALATDSVLDLISTEFARPSAVAVEQAPDEIHR